MRFKIGGNLKKILFFIVITLSLTLVYSQGKPCCKNKAKNGISCKFKQGNNRIEDGSVGIDGNTLLAANTEIQCPNSTKSTSTKVKICANTKKASWWKFWAKKGCCN